MSRLLLTATCTLATITTCRPMMRKMRVMRGVEEDEQAPVDSDMHPCNDNDMQANDAEDESDERWEEIKEQFLGGLEQYLQDIKTNRENSTNSSEGNSLREDHSTDQISEDDLSLDLDMTVQSAEFGHSTHTVTLRSLRPSEEHQKTSSTLREAGDGESEEAGDR